MHVHTHTHTHTHTVVYSLYTVYIISNLVKSAPLILWLSLISFCFLVSVCLFRPLKASCVSICSACVLPAGIGVPILLAYVYGVVPISLCRSGGCGVTTTNTGGVRFEFDEEAEANAQGNFSGGFTSSLVGADLFLMDVRKNNDDNVHLLYAYQCPELSHDWYYPKYDILYACMRWEEKVTAENGDTYLLALWHQKCKTNW